MLRRIRELLWNFRLVRPDGEFGFAEDVYFDATWTVRYLVTHLGRRFSKRLLIPICSLQPFDWQGRTMSLAHAEYAESSDAQLWSARMILGHRIQVRMEEVGHLDDLLVDDETWALRHLIVGSQSGGWLGRKILISPEWVEEVHEPTGRISVGLSRDEIQQSPEWAPGSVLSGSSDAHP